MAEAEVAEVFVLFWEVMKRKERKRGKEMKSITT
jgi:hypothetical protein